MDEYSLTFGAQVLCSDGKCGTLAKVAVNPQTWQVTHLIAEEGFLLKQARVFPFSAVRTATSAGIHLDLHSAELENYPLYQEVIEERPLPNPSESDMDVFWRQGVPYGAGPVLQTPVEREIIRHGVPDDAAVIGRGTPVDGLEGGIGKLDHFLVHPAAAEISQIIVQQGLLFTSKRAIPISLVKTIAENGIFVEASKQDLEGLPEYDEINDEAQAAWTNTSSESESADPTIGASGTRDLATRVSLALSEDPRTRSAVIEVIDERGVVTLAGEVDSVETHDAAEEITLAQAGVTTVVNLLRVRR